MSLDAQFYQQQGQMFAQEKLSRCRDIDTRLGSEPPILRILACDSKEGTCPFVYREPFPQNPRTVAPKAIVAMI